MALGVATPPDTLGVDLERLHLLTAPEALRDLGDDELLARTALIEELGRVVDAARIGSAGEVDHRSRRPLGSERLSVRRGCRTPIELLARLTRASERSLRTRVRLSAAAREFVSVTGATIAPDFPALAEAIAAGDIGFDSAQAIVATLEPIRRRSNPDDFDAAVAGLVACATGAEGDLPSTADQTRIQAIQWQAALDADGLEPAENEAMAQRGIVRTGQSRGLVHYRMELMPEISGTFERLLDAYLSPRTGLTFLSDEERAEAEASGDTRSAPQQRHDIFAAIVDQAARSGEFPTIGGAAPTVLVGVDAGDLHNHLVLSSGERCTTGERSPAGEPPAPDLIAGRGRRLAPGSGAGWIDGLDSPVSMHTVERLACAGGIQRVLFDSFGRIIELGSPERCFTPQQRRAIGLRDGGCIIPGCGVPAGWTEIHHVVDHVKDGETHPDNGVCLCWFHHHTLGTSGWLIRMTGGVPFVKPPRWLDPGGTWRPAGNNRTRSPGRPRGR